MNHNEVIKWELSNGTSHDDLIIPKIIRAYNLKIALARYAKYLVFWFKKFIMVSVEDPMWKGLNPIHN